jgi:hypothetical protein
MAPNRRQRALMLQMNEVDRRVDQKVRLLPTLKIRGRHGPCHGAEWWEQSGRARTGKSDEHKKRYSTTSPYVIENIRLNKKRTQNEPNSNFRDQMPCKMRVRFGACSRFLAGSLLPAMARRRAGVPKAAASRRTPNGSRHPANGAVLRLDATTNSTLSQAARPWSAEKGSHPSHLSHSKVLG